MSGAGSVGMYADKATLNNYGTIDLKQEAMQNWYVRNQ